VVALAIAVVIKSFLIQPFYIPSESMLPTIEVNDRVMVSKLSYRFGSPQRGDIVVFKSPFNGDAGEESIADLVMRHVFEALGIRAASAEDFIKRIAAVEGDRVEIHDNKVWVNGDALEEPYIPNDVRMNDEAPQVVPAGHVFVMGDNRDESFDSRRFGPIPVEDIVGEAVVRIWPIDRFGSVDSVPDNR
jgi:signal peptidase I